MDIVILLSQRSIYVVRYDDEADAILTYQEIYLEDLLKVEVGWSLFDIFLYIVPTK